MNARRGAANVSRLRIRTRKAIVIAAAIVLDALVFNGLAVPLESMGARLRVLISRGERDRIILDASGIPSLRSPRLGEYQSPFYVVHFGVQYSEACRNTARNTTGFEWRPDPTLPFWPHPSVEATTDRFRASADWVVGHIEAPPTGHAHLFYHFDWPYRNYPGGRLRAPWWSGLTDGHAITLLLRAEDCFGDPKYLDAARRLYESVTAPIEAGGSVARFHGLPWIEEYVDPAVPASDMSKVFNGMAYAYFGVRAFEEHEGIDGLSDSLGMSLRANAYKFQHGYWSLYDGLGTPANIKYHNVNLALLEDPRVHSPELQALESRWRIGARWPVPMFLLFGPRSVARLQFGVMFGLTCWFTSLILLKWPLRGSSDPHARGQE